MHPRNQTIADALAEARDHYAARRPAARAAFERASASLPGGNTRTTLHHGPFPPSIVSGDGATLTDADGHHYVNLLGEYTAGVFGHTHPVIRAAIDRTLDAGINLGAQTRHEGDLAKLVCQRFHAIEKVRFTNSGTEANLMAISTARLNTKRTHVMVMKGGYHGGLLYFAGGAAAPINAPYPFVFGTYNDIEATRSVIKVHAHELACVLIEPMIGSGGCIPADHAFIEMLRAETAAAGIILIFDEVMTSRFGRGGAQGLFNITPDLVSLGKWIGGGMSFGGFGGRAALMDIYDPTRPGHIPHAGTFNNNVLTMAAGVAALSTAFTADIAAALHDRGDRLRDRLNAAAAHRDVAVQATGIGSLLHLHPVAGAIRAPSDLARGSEAARDLLYFDLLERGYYMGRRGFMGLTLALTDDDLDGFVAAFDDVLGARRALLRKDAA